MNSIEFISILIGMIGVKYSASKLWGIESKVTHHHSSIILLFLMSAALILATTIKLILL